MLRFPWSSAAVTAAAAALSACGGGGGGGSADGTATPAGTPAPGEVGAPTPAPAPPPSSSGGSTAPVPSPAPGAAPAVPVTYPLPNDAQAARFLAQAGFAATPADIATLKSIGYSAWLDLQFIAPRTESRWDRMVRVGLGGESYKYNAWNGLDGTTWCKLIGSPDQLRQRMVLALSDLFIVSTLGINSAWRTMTIVAYADLLEDHAFGNFRQLLEAVALSPAMGQYLSMRGSRKEDAKTGRQPDENFAREVMQLFTIGLVQLQPDGTPVLSGGRPVETYGLTQITELARVFTGWDVDSSNPSGADPSYLRRPMVHNASRFSTGPKSVLGTVIPASADGPTAMRLALDTLCNHPNVGPFIGRQLIQRLVCSHPSPAYVQRVAAVFNDNGRGQRGDLQAVLRAILLDIEARQPSGTAAAGKLREPVQRFVQMARTTGLVSAGDIWAVGDTSNPDTRLGQCPFRGPSVFGFFRPGYVPPNSALAANAITAPEFQLCNETTVAGYLNFMHSLLTNGIGDLKADFTPDLALVNDTRAMVARQALLLAGDGISEATQSRIVAALNTINVATDAGKLNRVKASWLLLLSSPEYQIQK